MSPRVKGSKSLAVALVVLVFVSGILILLHQLVVWGRIDVDQILHHEFFGFVALSFTFGFALCVYVFRVRLPQRIR